ncbi:GNAT family N-acetyltransferase [Corallibacter sp.]|uniref:GNAT family N-acetyltransferase n=1 Tax=Corallibacter sp. TaxID=2038084 RepID=UPI003AB13F76
MTSIIKATLNDAEQLSVLASKTFLESHGHSAPQRDIDNYISLKLNPEVFKEELNDSNNIFYLLHFKNQVVGYSKITLNVATKNIPFNNVTKLERLYLLESYQDLKLGLMLFNFNIEISKKHNQSGIWLYTWVKNKKAIKFYEKAGFKIIGHYDFKISESHSNPNHQMLLTY